MIEQRKDGRKRQLFDQNEKRIFVLDCRETA